MDSDLKAQADALFSELGMNLTTAFNIFVRQSIREAGFRLKSPSISLTRRRCRHAGSGKNCKRPVCKGYNDLDELFADLKK